MVVSWGVAGAFDPPQAVSRPITLSSSTAAIDLCPNRPVRVRRIARMGLTRWLEDRLRGVCFIEHCRNHSPAML